MRNRIIEKKIIADGGREIEYHQKSSEKKSIKPGLKRKENGKKK